MGMCRPVQEKARYKRVRFVSKNAHLTFRVRKGEQEREKRSYVTAQREAETHDLVRTFGRKVAI